MIPYKKHKLIVGLLFVYMTGMYIYFFPRNNEMSDGEKWATVGASVVMLTLLWFLLKKRQKLRREREEDIERKH